jgi:RND family efflux transporter MFP subunit
MRPEIVPVPAEPEHEATFDPAPHRPNSRSLRTAGIVFGVFFVVLAAFGIIPRLVQHARVSGDIARMASEPAHILALVPKRAAADTTVQLPASVQGLQETIVYARTSGYIQKYLVDIGDKVKAGQVLALVETPEVDQELQAAQAMVGQAQAGVAQAKTRRALAQTNLRRTAGLVPQGVASQEELDERSATSDAEGANEQAATANLASAQANVRRLQELKGFAHVTAPFAGTITARSIDNGQLVTAGNGTGQALYHIAIIDTVRLFVHVPQIYAASVVVGSDAKVAVREYPKRVFTGKVTRTSQALDPATRTLNTEIQIDNKDGALLSGMFATVTLSTPLTAPPLLVPASALHVTSEGSRVAEVRDGKIHWQVVDVASDLGDQVAIANGLDEHALVVNNPSERLSEGMPVTAIDK